MLELNIVLFIFTLVYIYRRYKYQNKMYKIVGFFTNPLLYYVFFTLFYLIASNIFLMFVGLEFIMSMGVPISNYNFYTSSFYTTSFFIVGLFFYMLSKDINLNYRFVDIRTSKGYTITLRVISLFFLLCLIYILLENFSYIYSLQSYRTLAYQAYIQRIVNPYKYGVIINLATILIVLAILVSKDKLFRGIVLLASLLIILIDFSHGGRAATLKIILAIYISIIIYYRKSYFFLISSVVLLMLFSAILLRFSYDQFNITNFLFAFLSEFVFTRITTDLVLNFSLHGNLLDPFLSSISSLVPGQIASYFGIETKYLGMIIQDKLNLPIGLASNPVSESIYFFGSFYLLEAFLISSFLLLLNSKLFKSSMIPLIILIVYISSIQETIRNSFFDSTFSFFYLFYSYALIFTIMFYKKSILKFNNTRSIHD